MKRLFPAILMYSVLFFSCKKEKTNWTTNWSAPLVHGQLTINDLIPADYTTTNSDNYMSIVYNEKAYGIDLDDIVGIPDTSIIEKTALGFALTINPGFIWANSADQVLDLPGVELKHIMAKEGTITFICRSEWGGKTKMILDFPKVTYQGTPYYKEYYLDSGSVANPTQETDIVDMAGYWLDLTGVDGSEFNTLSGDFIVESNETVDTYNVATSDSLEYEINFTDVVLDYAKGYFGQHTLSDTVGIDLSFMNSIIGGTIDIDSIDFTITIRNGFNLLAQAEITLLRGVNTNTLNQVDLNFPNLNQILNINPATGGLYSWDYTDYPLTINNSNSNIAQFIENLSDSIYLGYNLDINPFGNVTGGSDEIFPGSTIDVWINGEFPVDLGANNLTLTDTFDLSYSGNAVYTGNSATITLDYVNGFPMGADAALYLLDENGNQIDQISGNTSVSSGTYNAGNYTTAASTGQVIFTLNQSQLANLELTDKIAVIVSFTTDGGQKVKVPADAVFDFDLFSNLQIELHL